MEFVKTFNVTVNYTGKGVIRDEESCTDCGVCVGYCPTGALKIEDRATREVVYHEADCIECLACIRVCPFGACTSAF
jgi:NAD-dependent dihydropyrimidine dehydrogenase PreA subunit